MQEATPSSQGVPSPETGKVESKPRVCLCRAVLDPLAKSALSHALDSVLTLWPHSLPPLPSPHCHTAPLHRLPSPTHLGPPPIPDPGVEHRTQQPGHLWQSLNSVSLPVSAGHRPRPWMAHRLLLPPREGGSGSQAVLWEGRGSQKGDSGRGKPKAWEGGFWVGFPNRFEAGQDVHRVMSCITRVVWLRLSGIKIKIRVA